MNTTIHRLSRIVGLSPHVPKRSCQLCGTPIPDGHKAAGGEYVGVITFADCLDMPPKSYRIGSNNRDRLCNGKAHTGFHQDSLGESSGKGDA